MTNFSSRLFIKKEIGPLITTVCYFYCISQQIFSVLGLRIKMS